jgi:curli biogenesis system outer membrane secretion channel CsgG
MPVKTGTSDSKSPATGSAAGAYSEGANTALERCDTPLGTLALYEDRYTPWYRSLSRYGIQSTEPALRLFAQQSGCFVVVERGKAFRNVQEERQLEASGELRQGSNFGKGQMVSADYTMTPTLIL